MANAGQPSCARSRSVGSRARRCYALYQGWIDTLLALQAARVTGAFAIAANAEHAAARRDALQECARLEAEIARLRAAAAKEKQMARQVELNLELKRVEAAKLPRRARL